MPTFSVRHAAGVLNKTRMSSELAAVKTQQPIAAEEEHRVLQFRPRTLVHRPGQRTELRWQQQQDAQPEPNDLSHYERDRDEPDDFRHRMLANIAAFAFTVALTAIGIWLAMSIAGLRPTPGSALWGRAGRLHLCRA